MIVPPSGGSFKVRSIRTGRRAVVLLVLCTAVAGCRSGHTTVLESPAEPARYATVTLERARFAHSVPEEAAFGFEERVRARTVEATVPRGPRLTIEYRILKLEQADHLEHWFRAGRDGGKRLLTVEVVFLDEERNKLARIEAVGYIRSGLLGGSLDRTLQHVADDVAEYVIANFLAGPVDA